MCSDLTDAMYWDKEDPNTIYHQFETKEGPNVLLKISNHQTYITLRLIIMIFNCDIAWYDDKGRATLQRLNLIGLKEILFDN